MFLVAEYLDLFSFCMLDSATFEGVGFALPEEGINGVFSAWSG